MVNASIPEDIQRAIEAVADRNGVDHKWLNNKSRISIVPYTHLPNPVFSGKVIEIYTADKDCLLISKLIAARAKDFDDTVRLIIDLGHTIQSYTYLMWKAGEGLLTSEVPGDVKEFCVVAIRAADAARSAGVTSQDLATLASIGIQQWEVSLSHSDIALIDAPFPP